MDCSISITWNELCRATALNTLKIAWVCTERGMFNLRAGKLDLIEIEAPLRDREEDSE
jgi:hypothetical protein